MFFYTFLPKLLNMSLTAGVAIVFVLLLRLLLKKAPKVISYALWGVVLIRLLCPVSIESELSLFGMFDTPIAESGSLTSRIEYVPSDIVHTEYPEIKLPVPGVDDWINQSLPQGREQLVADPLEAPMAIATYVWMAGVLGMAIYAAVSYLRLKRRLITASPLRDNIYLADDITSPFVLGVIKPKIYLPSAMAERERPYIILHEQQHIRRLDHILKLLAFAALSIHWFHPLVWIAFVLANRDMEMSCDEAVIKKMGDGILADYSASLLSLATGRQIIAGVPLAFGEGDPKGRIRNLANWKKPAFWVIVAAAAACAVLSVCLLTNPIQAVIDPSEVTAVMIDKTAVSKQRQDELIGLLNDHRKSSFRVGADDPNSLSASVEIHCSDGSYYLLHYQYYSGFSFHPKHPGEDDYRSILTRFDSDGKASNAWKLAYEFDDKFIRWYRQDAPTLQAWFDFTDIPDEAYTDEPLYANLPEFPNATFCYAGNIAVMDGNASDPYVLISGIPIWNAYFCDITGDGLSELCATVSTGFGMIDNRVIVYDYANGVKYELAERGIHDYTLSLQDGRLVVTKRIYNSETVVELGYPVCLDGRVQMIGMEEARPTDNSVKYDLTIGADKVADIQYAIADHSGGCQNADGSLFEKGSRVYLEGLDGLTDLRGLEITALNAEGDVIWSALIPGGTANTGFTHWTQDGWTVTKVS